MTALKLFYQDARIVYKMTWQELKGSMKLVASCFKKQLFHSRGQDNAYAPLKINLKNK